MIKRYTPEQMAGVIIFTTLEAMSFENRMKAIKNNPKSIELMKNADIDYTSLFAE